MELFIIKALREKKPRDHQYIYMMPVGNYNVRKKIKTSPIDHLYRWEEMIPMAGLLPAGNIETPNAQLQVEWFYMTFCKSDCAEYMQFGCKLCDKMLQTLSECFQSIYETCKNDGSLQRHQLKKVCTEAKCEMHYKLDEQYACKLHHFTSQHRSHGSYG
jgi:hypothetical protein